MDLVAGLNNEDTKRKKSQVFKNVSFDFRAIAVNFRRDCLFCYDTKYKAASMVL